MLEAGRHASISEIAAAEAIDRGHVGSILRLTPLAPDIVEAIIDGRQSPDLALPRLLQPFPLEWGSSDICSRGQIALTEARSTAPSWRRRERYQSDDG